MIPTKLIMTLYHNKFLYQLPVHAIPSCSDVTVTISGRLEVIKPSLDGLTVEHVAIVIVCFLDNHVNLVVKDAVVVSEQGGVITPEGLF